MIVMDIVVLPVILSCTFRLGIRKTLEMAAMSVPLSYEAARTFRIYHIRLCTRM